MLLLLPSPLMVVWSRCLGQLQRWKHRCLCWKGVWQKCRSSTNRHEQNNRRRLKVGQGEVAGMVA